MNHFWDQREIFSACVYDYRREYEYEPDVVLTGFPMVMKMKMKVRSSVSDEGRDDDVLAVKILPCVCVCVCVCRSGCVYDTHTSHWSRSADRFTQEPEQELYIYININICQKNPALITGINYTLLYIHTENRCFTV